jgi:hypothetical protein
MNNSIILDGGTGSEGIVNLGGLGLGYNPAANINLKINLNKSTTNN